MAMNEETGRPPRRFPWKWVIAPLLLAVGAIFWVVFDRWKSHKERMERRIETLQRQVDTAGRTLDKALEYVEQARSTAVEAEESARRSAEARAAAEDKRTEAERAAEKAAEESQAAQEKARLAQEEARAAREEADRIRKEREAEMNRLEQALNKVVETRRTALGVVMNLGSDAINFDFDKAHLKPKDRELLSRIAGILLTSSGYRIYVYGHTDDVGGDEYNLELSERRSNAVRDYLVEAGVDPSIIATKGFGKSSPRVPNTSETARAANRRVEVGVVDTIIEYQGTVKDQLNSP